MKILIFERGGWPCTALALFSIWILFLTSLLLVLGFEILEKINHKKYINYGQIKKSGNPISIKIFQLKSMKIKNNVQFLLFKSCILCGDYKAYLDFNSAYDSAV